MTPLIKKMYGLLASGRYEELLDYCTLILCEDPLNFEALKYKAYSLYFLGLYEEPLSQYSSTSNQSMLQYGPMYLTLDQERVALDCNQGYKKIQEFASKHSPSAIKNDVDCYFLFPNASDYYKTKKKCDDLKIENYPVKISELMKKEPLLKNVNVVRALKTLDRPIDTSTFLKALVRVLRHLGVHFVSFNSKITSLDFKRSDDGWIVITNDAEYKSNFVVACAGATIPKILEKILTTLTLSV